MSRASDARRDREELRHAIRRVRRRWRLRLALKGAAVALAAAVLLVAASAWGVDRLGFSPGAVGVLRVACWAALVGAAAYVLLPLLRRVADERVALYLEEHDRTLRSSILAAVAAAEGEDAPDRSPVLVERLVRRAVDGVKGLDYGRAVERRGLLRAWATLGGVALVALVLFAAAPLGVRRGASTVLMPWRSAEAANPYAIEVAPGDTLIARGGDVSIRARPVGFDVGELELLVRAGDEDSFERYPMLPGADSGAFEALLFGVEEAGAYFVQSGAVRSPLFRIAVADLPHVERLVLEYHFPAYTGLPPRTVEQGGDIAVLPGTRVVVNAFATLSPPGGRILLEPGDPVELEPAADGPLTGDFRVEREGFYQVELDGPAGRPVTGTPRYAIDLLEDLPPSVSFEKPGRDTRATNIEEVFLEARAEDDYGVTRLELVYSVNGGEERTMPLYRASGNPLREVSAGHTFYLEELDLRPGDFLAYHARASDGRPGQDGTRSSDIYFLEIRAFRKDYRQADAAPPPGGMQGGGAADEALSEQQRRIIAGTFNALRDRKEAKGGDFDENVVTLTLAQERLKEQVETLVERMRNRGVAQADSGFLEILELLPRAAAEMEAAAAELREKRPQEALAPEQRALQQLLRAEERYRDVQVAFQSGSQGGGGGGGPDAEDLADLFELELDKLQNQYETLQRGQQQQADQQVDEVLERLKELARRQEQEAERQRRAAASPDAGGGAASQRRLAEEVEEEARRLERLSRESSRPELEEMARDLRAAADAMRRAAAARGNDGTAQADAALDRIREARRRLERERESRVERDAQDALRRAERMEREQREITDEVRGLPGGGPEREEALRSVQERKEALAEDVAELERQLDRMAADARQAQDEASAKLQEAAGGIRESKLKEAILYSRGVMRQYPPEDAARFEEERIGEPLRQLRERLAEASDLIEPSQGTRSAEALDRARDLLRGAESLDERLRERMDRRLAQRPEGQGESGGQPGEGEAGAESGQQGQAGERGQEQPGGGQPGQAERAGGARGEPSGLSPDAPPGVQGDGAPPEAGPPGGGAPGMRRGDLTPEEVRQYAREFRERLGEAQELRRQLEEQGIDPEGLERVMEAMSGLASAGAYSDAARMEALRRQVVEGLKEFEYGLRRELAGEAGEKLYLSGSQDVPPGFRELVEEYYRRLARERR